jgi:hypothetical protein
MLTPNARHAKRRGISSEVEDMPTITIKVNDYELKLIKRIARHERMSVPKITGLLAFKTLEIIRQDERTGQFYYGHVPKLQRLDKSPSALWLGHRPKVSAFCADWTKVERDTWILNGIEPARVLA